MQRATFGASYSMTRRAIGKGGQDDQAVGGLGFQPVKTTGDGQKVNPKRQMLAVVFLNTNCHDQGRVGGNGVSQVVRGEEFISHKAAIKSLVCA